MLLPLTLLLACSWLATWRRSFRLRFTRVLPLIFATIIENFGVALCSCAYLGDSVTPPIFQRSFVAFARVVVSAIPKSGVWTAGSASAYTLSPQTWATRLGEHVCPPATILTLAMSQTSQTAFLFGFIRAHRCRCWRCLSTWTESPSATASRARLVSMPPLCASQRKRVTIRPRYTNELVEQIIDLIVAAVTKIDCINAPGLRQLHVDLDYVANCCR